MICFRTLFQSHGLPLHFYHGLDHLATHVRFRFSPLFPVSMLYLSGMVNNLLLAGNKFWASRITLTKWANP